MNSTGGFSSNEKYHTIQFQHFILKVKLPASLQMQGEKAVQGCYW